MIYSKDDISKVLWNTFTVHAKEIKFLEQVGEEYLYEVILEDDVTLDYLNDVGGELEESGLFDVMSKGNNKLMIRYTAEDELMDITEMRIFVSKVNENISSNYVEFDDSMIGRIKKLYSFLPQNIAYNNFVISTYNQVLKNKKLTKKQWTNLEEILNTGKSTYNNNKLTTKN